ncbi:hypothetical protein ACFWMX_31380 [Streptomyces sp. NPDC058378]|uniref:hypothetical protein n=1 Tax=unclassified Streptomyces TaxID=2593676 RepID=UPI0036547AFC
MSRHGPPVTIVRFPTTARIPVREVLIAESRIAPTVEAVCKVTAGERYSYDDGLTLTAPGGLDIGHVVPLAEAWGS